MVPDPQRRWRLRGTEVEITVVDLGLACCAVECAVAFATRPDLFQEVSGGTPAASPVLLVSGTVTDALRPGLLQVAERLGPGAKVLSFGSCANTGGPYWDSYSVTKGIDQVLPVDSYVAGCAPTPEALVAAVLELAGR